MPKIKNISQAILHISFEGQALPLKLAPNEFISVDAYFMQNVDLSMFGDMLEISYADPVHGEVEEEQKQVEVEVEEQEEQEEQEEVEVEVEVEVEEVAPKGNKKKKKI